MPHCNAQYGQCVAVVRGLLDSDTSDRKVLSKTHATLEMRARSVNLLDFGKRDRKPASCRDQKSTQLFTADFVVDKNVDAVRVATFRNPRSGSQARFASATSSRRWTNMRLS